MSTLKVNALTNLSGNNDVTGVGKILQAKCTASNSLGQTSRTADSYGDITGLDLLILLL